MDARIKWFLAVGVYVYATALVADENKDLFGMSLEQLNAIEVKDTLTQAQKQTGYSSRVPFSLTIFENDKLFNPLLNSSQDIDQLSSGLVTTYYNEVTPQLYIRGIGSNSSGSGDDPSVAYLREGINVARPGFHNIPLFDFARVEVIEGPQGALYGKDVIGGAINIVNNSPSRENQTELALSPTQRGGLWSAMDNSRINDEMANRISLTGAGDSGWINNTLTATNPGQNHYFSGREQVMWWGDNRQLRIEFEYGEDVSSDPAYIYSGEPPSSTLGGRTIAPYANSLEKIASDNNGATAKHYLFGSITYQIDADIGRWVSVTGLNKGDYNFDLFFNPIVRGSASNSATENSNQVSEEFRFEQKLNDLEWHAGASFSAEKIDRNESIELRPLIALFGLQSLDTPDEPGFTRYISTTEAKNAAIFMHGSWHFLPKFNFTVGLRQDYVKKDFKLDVAGGDIFNISLLNGVDFAVNANKSWNEISYNAALDYSPTESVMWYAAINTGFKPGSFNSLSISAESALASSKPELARNYEIGLKSFLLQHRLQNNIALFYVNYANLQVFSAKTSESNAPQAVIQGGEWSSRYKVSEGLEFNANYTYLNTAFSDYIDFDGNNLQGNSLPRSPKISLVAGVNYSWLNRDLNRFWWELQGAYTGEHFIQPNNNTDAVVPAYHQYHTALYWQPGASEFYYSVWIRNISNDHFVVHAVGQSSFSISPHSSSLNIAPARTIGASLYWSFR